MSSGPSGARGLIGTSPAAASINSIIKELNGMRLQSSGDILVTRTASGTTLKVNPKIGRSSAKGVTATVQKERPFEVRAGSTGFVYVSGFSRLCNLPGYTVTISGLGSEFATPSIGSLIWLQIEVTPSTLGFVSAAIQSGSGWTGAPYPIVNGDGDDSDRQRYCMVPIAEIAAASDTRAGTIIKNGTDVRKIIQLLDTHLCLFIQAFAGRAAVFAMPWGAPV